MGVVRVIVTDFLHGVSDSLTGILFIRRLLEEDAKEPVVEPPKRREKTVLELRREQKGIFRRPPAPPKKKDSFAKKLSQIYGMNLLFLVVWQIFIRILAFVFGFFDRAELGYTIGSFLCWPIFLASRIIQALWFSDISGACMRALNQEPQIHESMGKMLNEMLLSLVHQTFFLFQGILSQHLPIPLITPIIVFIHMALLNSMYCFDYFFDSYNFFLNRRRYYFETKWPYFIGFGTPLALACSMVNDTFINSVIFALLFPLFIISSYKANWARKYDEPVPYIAHCRIAAMFTKLTADGFKKLTTLTPPAPIKVEQKSS
ncbi:CBN-EPG-4 protein [Caenorhabditis brenneri]|uniref:CBN-EPG-4 protein n=1 Tax=Caenorhabditis brenneri TaxID=135651 RepID=G0N5L2_CAEBE|nr:CBN-EPG-4 protein [Caenorhabditis brenneri]